MRQTPLHPHHAALGATFTTFAGWRMPLRYTGETAEHHAVRKAAGLFDLSHMGQIEVSGLQAGTALDYALTGHLSALEVGGARYTLLCHDNGGILDDLVVYRLAGDRFLVVANARNTPMVLAMLNDRVDGYLATVRQETGRALIAVQGPAAAAVLATQTATRLAGLRYYSCVSERIAGMPVLLARTGYTGEDGFEIFCDAREVTSLWALLHGAGRGHGLVAAGLACRDTLRLEAGMALHGHELHVGVTPMQAGLARLVDFAKPGDFVGRGALAGLGEPPVTLAGLVGDGRRPARAGYQLTDLKTGRQIGTVTSGAVSPTLRRPIALGYLPPGYAGQRIGVRIRESVEPFTVGAPRFYRRRQP